MLIGVAGPYSADTEEQRQKNLDAMNIAAAKLLEKGHTPLIGVNAALPIIQALEKINSTSSANFSIDKYETIMKISLAVIDKCEALLLIGESPGANRERDLVLSKGLKVYYAIDDVPNIYSA
jgi:hypothetical protein